MTLTHAQSCDDSILILNETSDKYKLFYISLQLHLWIHTLMWLVESQQDNHIRMDHIHLRELWMAV